MGAATSLDTDEKVVLRSVKKEDLASDDNTSMSNVVKQAETILPTEWGEFIFAAYADDKRDYMPHLTLRHPDLDTTESVYVRIHSECITGDIFHSMKCDCGQQLDAAMKILQEKKGILIYLRQEGRGIGIINKIKAYNHQEKGLDTVEANEALGLKSDYRKYDLAAEIFQSMGINRVNLITNNPDKIDALNKNGIIVESRIPLQVTPNEKNREYLRTKKQSMGHLFNTDI